ncbi:MAG TPA: ABC transporter permease, partial [Tepidisphaeraceae bacterium]
RNMMMALADPPAMWRKLMQDVDEAQQAVTADLKRATVLQASPEKLDIVKDRSLIDRIVKIIETDSSDIQDKLFRLRIIRPEQMQTEAEKGAHKEALAGLEAEQIQLSALKFQFQQNPGQLTGDAPLAYMKRTLDRLTRLDKENGERRAALQRRVDLYCWLADRLQRNANPDERSNNSRLLELVVGLDLSDQGVRVGPMYFGQFQRTAHLANIQDFRDWLNKQVAAFGEAKPEAAWWGEVKAVIDLDPLTGSRSAASWLCAPLALPSEMCMNWGVPAFSMITLDDLRLRRDTPTDTLGHIDVDKILKQLSAVKTLLFNAWNAPKFKGPVEIRWQRNFLEGQVVSPAPGRPVPDLPREDFLATYYYCSGAGFMPEMRRVPWTLGVRRSEVVDSDAEGRYIFEGLGRGVQWDERWLIAQVYQVEKNTGEITSCSDMGNQAGDMSPYGDTFTDITPRHSVVFHCREFSLTGLYDPRFLQDLTELTPLDARRNDVPQRFNLILSNQMMAGFVEPDVSTHLLFRYGRVGNRLVLLNMQAPAGKRLNDPMDAARGFSVDQLNSLGPLALQTARDFWTLDALRLEDYRKAGVSSSLLDALQSEAASQLSQARDVYPAQRLLNAMGDPSAQRLLGMFRAQDAAELIDSANGAWARDARVYSAAKDMANDVIRAAIFLLLLCIPFSFCMERLVIGSTNVYKQIAWTFAIFAVMTAALWSFHPAFKISASPLIIILAFAIILMSLVVIGVIYGKFDTELKRLRSGRGTAATTSFARASVLMSAVLLGIANMRKRKFRTALTSITIILITFAVLCFTSASKYLDTTTLETGIRSQYEGIMLRQRGFRPLPEVTLQNLHAVLREHLRQHPQWLLVQRWWNANAADPREQYHVVASGAVAGESKPRVFAANAMLGLTPGESELNPDLASVIPNFARLEAGEERVIYLSKTTATVLKVKEGDKVQLGAIELEVAGLYDADQFDQKMLALSGDSICPVNYGATNADASGKALSYVGTEAFSLDADAASSELSGTYEHLSGNQIAVIPASVCRLMPNPSLRSVALRVKDDQEVKAVSSELSKRFAVAMFAGYKDGVKMVSASNLSSVSGAGQVAIPLAIAGLIIFNTMMGSIAERRREIHVYTSLGLAPVHVGALFVAEALTYGLIGTVFGYVIGQGVGTALLKLGWLGNVTLNYSGTSAMLTMGLILIIVLLSALVPARLASKIAAPSIER